jgi:hypothetical protein
LYILSASTANTVNAFVGLAALYALSLAPVTWVLLSEIFPNRIRGAALSVSTFSLWAACFLLTYTFPHLNQGLGPAGTFWIYAGISVLGFLFIRSRVRETKGKTLLLALYLVGSQSFGKVGGHIDASGLSAFGSLDLLPGESSLDMNESAVEVNVGPL